jgi:hypothetical protein
MPGSKSSLNLTIGYAQSILMCPTGLLAPVTGSTRPVLGELWSAANLAGADRACRLNLHGCSVTGIKLDAPSDSVRACARSRMTCLPHRQERRA